MKSDNQGTENLPMYRQRFHIFATHTEALAAGWPDAEYGTWQRRPSSTELVDGWIALDYEPLED